MKHAQENILDKFVIKINKIRDLTDLKEKKKGIFYKKSSAFLHFHQDNNLLFVDLKIEKKLVRFKTEENREWALLLKQILIV
ncbi:MAG: hypothetical protein H7263_09760 [Candidatus Sericytochromatia bacterium]|nr:hypothetical protein [Candidatus Sericytochromatia bacterium]